MIPLKDNIPTDRFPIVTLVLVVANVASYLFFQHAISHSLLHIDQLNLLRYGAIPFDFSHPAQGCVDPSQGALQQTSQAICQPATLLTPITSMFMHGGILHLAGNMLFLWIFGNNVEDAMGRPRFVVFYLAGGLAAFALQLIADPNSLAPTIGASGAIAGVLGGYILLYPRARVLTGVFLIIIFFVELPAIVVLGFWFVEQLVFANARLSDPTGGGGVAYFAHVGGFVFGLLLIHGFVRRRQTDLPRTPAH